MKFRYILGIDFGGSGIKGAPVDTKNGKLIEARFRIPTPIPAAPDDVSEVIRQIVKHFKWEGPLGVTFPAVVQNGVVKTASNIDKSWIGKNAANLIGNVTGLPVFIVNDADAAGLAEMKFGAGKKSKGSVILITVGTGLGTVLFTRGKLVPNTELGHIYLKNGLEAESFTSDAIRKKEGLEWDEWARRFNMYLQEIEKLLWPEKIIIGGGISKKQEKFIDFITIESEIVMAKTRNEAGIIGAALAARYNRNLLKEMI
ncbi:MAG: ROK family protein [Bacteroidales bacterium]|nr:ROK family protein [Bacteroidales bacterium]